MSRHDGPRGAYGPVAQRRTSVGGALPLLFEITAGPDQISENVSYEGGPVPAVWPVPGTAEAAEFGPGKKVELYYDPELDLLFPASEPEEWDAWTDWHVELAPPGDFIADLDAFDEHGLILAALRMAWEEAGREEDERLALEADRRTPEGGAQ